jgi:hypothetical protein
LPALYTPCVRPSGIRLRLLKSINMTREKEIAKRMNELERQYRETRDEKITEELYRLARELKKLKKES